MLTIVNLEATIIAMSKFSRITAFIAVVEEHGFAAAARKQQVSTAAISRQVARLESELNTLLISRTKRQISLTEIGAQYYEQVKKTIDELYEAELAIEDSQTVATGLLTVTSSRYFATQHILPRLPEFMALNPQLRVNLELAERFTDLAEEGIDLIFGMSIESSLSLVRKRVADTRYILCCSPNYLKQYGTPEVPSDLSKHRYITHSMRKPNNKLILKGNKELEVNPVLWLNDRRAMRDCAIAGMGIVNLHDYIVEDAIQSGDLVEILYGFQETVTPVYLYYQQRRYLQPKIRNFIDFYTL